MTHVLACALYCNSDGSLNSGGQFLADAGIVLVVAMVVIWVIRTVARGVSELAPKPKRPPAARTAKEPIVSTEDAATAAPPSLSGGR